ncbi:MAG: hypothetical protein LUH56_07265 [Oscillospiraceae bacterium]|nr:hypothetical protein [Oscillospiraceae bacterium]
MKEKYILSIFLSLLLALTSCSSSSTANDTEEANPVEDNYIVSDDLAESEQDSAQETAEWVQTDSGWSYYIDGEMCTGTVDFDGITYTFSDDGIWDGQGYLSLTSESYDNTGETIPGIVDGIKSIDGAEEIYSGCYLDDGMSVVVSTDTEKMTEIVSELYPGYIEIMVVSGDYNEVQLTATKNAISEKISEFNISCWTSNKDCRVVIGTVEVTDELSEFVDSLEYSGCVVFQIVESMESEVD